MVVGVRGRGERGRGPALKPSPEPGTRGWPLRLPDNPGDIVSLSRGRGEVEVMFTSGVNPRVVDYWQKTRCPNYPLASYTASLNLTR